jgi:hypothetical protein
VTTLKHGKPRYRRNPRRNELPEIAMTEVEVEVAREIVSVDARNPLGTAPVYVALIDLAAPEETLELVRSAVLAAIEAVGPDALFGIVTFSNRVGLYDVQGAVPSVRHVAVSEDGPLIMPLEDALPLERLLAPVGRYKEELAAAVETLAPATDPRRAAAAAAMAGAATLGGDAEMVLAGGGGGGGSGNNANGRGEKRGDGEDEKPGCRAFGPALEALLTWLGAEGVAGEGDAGGKGGGGGSGGGRGAGGVGGGATGGGGELLSHPSCRILSFLAGLPDLGDGALTDERYRDVEEDLAGALYKLNPVAYL